VKLIAGRGKHFDKKRNQHTMSSRLDRISNWPERAELAKWCVQTLAEQCRVSPRTLQRYFLMAMGQKVRRWLNEDQMHRAFELLMEGFTVKETAARLDYHNAANFSRAFKKTFGYSPAALNRQPSTKDSQMSLKKVDCR